MPAGFTDEFYDTGYQLAGLAEVRTPVSWVDVRFAGGYQWLGSWTDQLLNPQGSAIGDAHSSVGLLSGTAGLVLRVPNLRTAVRPYALAGVGSYWVHEHGTVRFDGTGPAPWNRWTRRLNGLEAGLGLEAPLAHVVVFAEARYQRVGPALRFVPISVGLRLP
jgi:hypothetical protein